MATMNSRIVLRNDSTSNWLTNNEQILLKGEVGVEFLDDGTVKIKIGDGTKTWEQLEYFGGEEVFEKDLVLTKAFGKYTPDSTGSVTVPAEGKTMEELLLNAFSEEANPTTTKPSISLANVGSFKAYEVGSKVTPAYTINFDSGKYTYDSATGVTATGYSATFNGETLETKTGTFAELTVEDGTNLRMSAKANYSDGVVPKTNLGNDYAAGQIKAGTTEVKYSNYITGYRNSFYGTKEKKETVDSAAIRSLVGVSNKTLANGAVFNVSVPVKALRVIIAYPATLRDLSSVIDVNGLNAEIKSSFTKSVVSVEGANGATAIDYKVFTLDFADTAPNDTANTYKVTI